jgi:beta-N-acetylhexosaminidase
MRNWGQCNDLQRTSDHARQIATTLRDVGISVNLAPVVDLDANPRNPIIKGKKRSFSSDPEIVARQAEAFCRAHLDLGILPCAKHFPGHGSAQGDTHCGLVDVSAHWSERELIPFQRLVQARCCPLIMSAHVFHRGLDVERPATLSAAVLGGLLRRRLGFEGVILTDDMEMKAITSQFGLEKAVQYAVEAGADVLCFGNNLAYDARIGEKAWNILVRLVENGVIPESRIDESFRRIERLKGI